MLKTTLLLSVCAFATTMAAPAPDIIYSVAQQKVLDRLKNSAEWETVGQIGSKTFIKNTYVTNWMGGRDICSQGGLEFATFADTEEFRFISYNGNAPAGLWVSGQLRGAERYDELTAFHWYADGASVPRDINLIVTPSRWLCLFHSNDDHTYADSCIDGRHQTLCQLRLG